MQNRGNGKGGGIAAVGLVPEQIGVSREVLDSHYLLQIALLDPDGRRRGRAAVHPAAASTWRCRRASRTSTTTATSRAWRSGRPTSTATSCASSRPCSQAFAETNGLWRAGAARPRGRVRLPQLVPPERHVLRLAGREAGLRAVARPRPAGLQDRRLRRAERRVLPARGLQGARLDRPPALPHQGARLAPGRRAPVRRA